MIEQAGSSEACSGTLLNDLDPSGDQPYFLTANHCVNTESVARTAEVAWYYQLICGTDSQDERFYRTIGGAHLLATSEGQDSTLLLLRGQLPGGLTLSGWSGATTIPPLEIHNISHPAGEWKKYAAGVTTGTRDVQVDDFIVRDAIEVEWRVGTTEEGSSGSGLLHGGSLIGVLSAGPENCSSTDYFGAFADFYPYVAKWLSRTVPDDHGDVRSLASRVGENSTIQGNLEQGEDVDYYRFEVQDRGTVTAETTGSTDTVGTLENAAGRQLASNDDGGAGENFKIERSLGPGTYYVRVEGFFAATTGRYTVRIRHRTETVAAAPTQASTRLHDFNGDGRADVLLRRTDNGRWTYYPMNGRRVLPGRGGVPLSTNLAWRVAGVGDFNGDRRATCCCATRAPAAGTTTQ